MRVTVSDQRDGSPRRRPAPRPSPDPANTGGAPGQPAAGGQGGTGPTFAELQRAGKPRPGPQMMTAYGAGPAGVQHGMTQPGQQPNVTPMPAPGGAPPAPQGVPQPPGGPPPVPQNLEAQLHGRFQNAGSPSPFRGRSATHAPPTFVPGANPFQMPMQGSQAPGAYNPASFAGQYTPVQGPGQGGQLADATQAATMQGLASPSRYDAKAVQDAFAHLVGGIDDQYAQGKTAVDEEMARRGIYDSTIAGGRLHDLNIGRRSAQTQLAGDLIRDQAATYGSDRANAIAQAIGLGGQQFDQSLAGAQFAGSEQARALGFGLDVAGFNNQAGQQGFQNRMDTSRLGEQYRQNLLNDQLNVGGFNRQLGLDRYNAGMGNQQFRAGEDQRRFGNELAGYDANLRGRAQGFDQQSQALAQLLGYGQQAFNNQMSSAQFNAQRQDEQFRQMMAMFGLT